MKTLKILGSIGAFALVMLVVFKMGYMEGANTDEQLSGSVVNVINFNHPPIVTEVTTSCYNPTAKQCDKTPLVTADGSKIDTVKLKHNQLRWLAVSQDLLKTRGGLFNFGDTIYIFHDNPFFKGKWIVHDCMGAKSKQMIDFLVDGSRKDIHPPESVLISNGNFYTIREQMLRKQ